MNGVPPVADGLIANLLAFLTGALLYAMLIALVVHGARTAGRHWWSTSDRLPLLTGVAGLVWNFGGLLTVGLVSPLLSPAVVWIQAIAFTTLGALPAFIVHSLFQGGERVAGRAVRLGITWLAYALPLGAGVLNGRATVLGEPVPATSAVWLLTIGFTALTAVVLLLTRRGPVGRRGIWVAAAVDLCAVRVPLREPQQQHTVVAGTAAPSRLNPAGTGHPASGLSLRLRRPVPQVRAGARGADGTLGLGVVTRAPAPR